MEHMKITTTEKDSNKMQLDCTDDDSSSGKDAAILVSDNRNDIQLLNSNSRYEERSVASSGKKKGKMNNDMGLHSSTFNIVEESILLKYTSTGHQEENHVNISSCVQDGASSSMGAESISLDFFRKDAKDSSVDDLKMSYMFNTMKHEQMYLDKINDKKKSSFIKVRVDIISNIYMN